MILYVIFVSGEMIGAHLARNEQKTLLNAAGNGSTGPNCFLHFSILCIVVRTRDTVANQNTYTNSFRFFGVSVRFCDTRSLASGEISFKLYVDQVSKCFI